MSREVDLTAEEETDRSRAGVEESKRERLLGPQMIVCTLLELTGETGFGPL